MNSSYLYLNQMRFHYLHWNLGDTGRPALLLHGLASNARIWDLTAPYLVERGLLPLAPDLRGHGLTDKPEGDYGFDTFHRDLLAFVNAMELDRPIIVGHSWGGMLALDFAARFPAGPRAPAGIVLIDGGMTQMDDHGATWEATRDRLTPPRLAGTPLDTFVARLTRPNPRWVPGEEAIQIILANFEITEDETISPRLDFDHHMQIVRAMWDFKTYASFERVRCPVLLVPARPAEPISASEQEYLVKKEQGIEQARQRLKWLTVRWMENSVHDIPLQRPAELADIIAGFANGV